MENKNLPRIEQLFHSALMMDAAERSSYLARECAGEEELCAEVESLVAAFEKRADFLEVPVFDAGLKALVADSTESLSGQVIGSYQIGRLLGKGGMGEVYLAEDTRLGRQVALKFLAQRLAADNWAKRQLIKEARAVAMLDHPNICAVYGLEEAAGHSFIVMQYLEGEVLADILRRGRLDARLALPLAIQMVSALIEAHSHGIIHRDIKPRNLILTPGGQLKMLDFGLAKVVHGKQSAAGVVDTPSHASQGLILGTVAYMSPEQLRGERLDFRSDVFSLGAVLCELACGRHPFDQGNDAETIAAIMTQQPQPLARNNNSVPAELHRIALRCLEKDREKRYQSASELLYDLGNVEQGGNGKRKRLRLFQPGATAVLMLLLIVMLSTFLYHRLTKPYTLAVLPITNESFDTNIEYLGDSLAESIIAKFSRLPKLHVKPFTAVSGYKVAGRAPHEAGREINVDAVLVGKIVREGESLVLKTELFDSSNGAKLWSGQYKDINTVAISGVQQDIVSEVIGRLNIRLRGNEEKILAIHDTGNEEALREYFRGRHWWRNRNKENIQKAVEMFNAAIALDPAFAKAHAGLSDCYALMNSPAYGNMPTEEAMDRARAEAKQALEINDSLPEAHTSLAVVHMKYDWNWAEAETLLKRAISLSPDYAPAHYWYSTLLTITGRQSEALTESELARKLDPLSPLTRMNFCRQFYFGRQFDRAAACLNKMLSEDSANVSAQRILGFVYLQKGMNDEAVEIFEKIPENNKALKMVALGYSYARVGRRAEALQILTEVEELSRHTYIPPHELAVIYLGLHDKDRAFAWLNKACDEHFATMIFLTVDPAFDSLREDPRYGNLVRRLNLPTFPQV